MTTKYECDITGKQYDSEDMVREVGFYDCNGQWSEFDFGPDATIDEVRARLHGMVDEMVPFHPEWWHGDQAKPPRLETTEIDGESFQINVTTVYKP